MKTKIQFILFFQLLIWSGFSFAQHFQPVWNTPFNPMTIIAVGATLNSQPLQAGDEIGVFDAKTVTSPEFCVGRITLTQPVSPEQFVQIVCSMDDGTNTFTPNGFLQNHNFIFRYWKNSIAQEITGIHIDFPYPGYDEKFTGLGTAIVTLSVTQQIPETQTINLNQGWTGISAFLIPQNTNVEQLFSSISGDLVILQNFEGQYYQPSGNNTLINWNYQDGYFVKTNSATSFTIPGYQATNKQITLSEGWNLLPVLSTGNVNITNLFAGHLSKVKMIKEAIGFKIFWPENQISTLELLEPGKSYLIYMNQEATIVF